MFDLENLGEGVEHNIYNGNRWRISTSIRERGSMENINIYTREGIDGEYQPLYERGVMTIGKICITDFPKNS